MKNLLTIAGSDSSGGAGIQADLKTFAAHGTFGMSVITAVTAQNTCGVTAVQNIDCDIVEAQIAAVFDDIRVDAVKIGMVSQPEIIRTIAACLRRYQPRIIVVDPMGEYSPLIRRLGGQVIEIAPDSPHHINPMDIDLSFDEENPMALKADFILSLMELIVGGKDGLQPVERTVIDRCVRQMYREHLQDPETSKMPTLQTLYDLLCSQPEGEAVRLATALEIYVSGSLNVFNHETNVDLNRRLVCLDLKKLGAGLRTIAMLIMQDLVNSQVSMNFLRGIATWCYFDEFHVLLRDRLTASYCVAIWKMLRKKGCVPSALTQNVKDFLASPEIENIFENSDFLVLLSQAQGDRQILAKQLGISPHQLSYVTHTNSGEGLLFFGNTTIPFVDRFPQNTELYAIMTTRPEDKKQEMNRA